MVQHAGDAGKVQYDPVRHLHLCPQECHSQKERGHYGVLLKKAR